jgi:large subunit ribosomal protein L21
MYAVVRTGGKQYRMAPGQVVQVEKLPGEAGDSIDFPEVLAVVGDGDVRVGDPLLPEARVSGEIVAQKRARKILVFKSKRRKGYRKMRGHRQSLTEVKITGIDA